MTKLIFPIALCWAILLSWMPTGAVALNSNTQMYGIFQTSGSTFLGVASLGNTVLPRQILSSKAQEGLESQSASYSNGVIYAVGYDSNTYDYTNMCDLYAYDALTGAPVAASRPISDRYFSQCSATDPLTGLVWGRFNGNAAHDRWEIACVNFKTLEKRIVGLARRDYICMGMNTRRELYAFAKDGNLYRISTEDGSETLVGATGLTDFVDSGGETYIMNGAINPDDGLFYISYADNNFRTNHGSVVAIDTQTAQATKVGDYPQIYLARIIYFPTSSAENDAPALVNGFEQHFPKGALTGNVTFSLPTKTYAGQELTGQLDYEILVDGISFATGSGVAGSSVTSAEVTFAQEGMHCVQVFTRNSAGDGAKLLQVFYVGMDVPAQPEHVSASVAADGRTTISWEAPTGSNGGYAGDESSLIYTVTRYPGGKIVGQGVVGTSFVDTLDPEGDVAAWYYGIKARNEHYEGTEEGFSNKNVFGAPLDVPYTADFSTPDLFTMIDVQGDGKSFSVTRAAGNDVMGQYSNNDKGLLDDWVVTPKINLVAGVTYRFTLPRNLWSQKLNLTLAYGTQPTVEALTHIIGTKEEEKSTTEWKELSFEFVATESGAFYIGLHSVQDYAARGLYMSRPFVLEEVPGENVASAPSNLQVTGADKGEKSATIRFTAPTRTVKGDPISGLFTVKVIYHSRIVHTFSDVQPGQSIEWTYASESIADGFNTFTVAAVTNEGTGITASNSAYVGIDTPQAPTGVKVKDENGGITISWETVTERGANGYYVNPDEVTYIIYDYTYNDEGVRSDFEEIGSVIGKNSFFYEEPTNEGDQRLTYKAIRARNATGTTGYVLAAPLVKGTPYGLPFEETLAGGETNGKFWWYVTDNTTQDPTISTKSYDANSGCFSWTAGAARERASINTGKISLQSASNKPVLSYAYYAEPGSTQTINVYLQTPDGMETRVSQVNFSTLKGDDGWRTELVDLTPYRNQSYVAVKFQLSAGTRNESVLLDAIDIYDQLPYNLSVDVSAPTVVKAGAEAGVTVSVRNTGENDITGFKVTLFADDEEVFTQTVSGTLTSQEMMTLPTNYKIPADFEDDYVVLRAEVETLNSPDLDDRDNWIETEVDVREATAAQPVLVQIDKNAQMLSWQTPGETTEQIVEMFDDFESFDNAGISFSSPFGWLNDWLVYDGDGEDTDNFTVDYPGKSIGASSWMVWNTGLSVEEAPQPLIGSKYLIAFNPILGAASDWLVSPKLSRKPQTVSLSIANIGDDGFSTIEVLYTTSQAEPSTFEDWSEVEDFTKTFRALTRKQLTTNDWDGLEVELPDGTTHFAIRNVSSSATGVAVALASFEKGNAAPESFNIYQDGVLTANVKATEPLSYTLTDPTAAYAVSAVYANGEESRSVTPVDVTGIKASPQSKAKFDVYTLDGSKVRSNTRTLHGLKSGLYIINGKSVIIK